MKFYQAGALLSLVLLVLSPFSVYAASVDLQVKLFQPVSTCPTIQKDLPPLGKSALPIFVTNSGDRPDTVSLSLSLPDGWSGFIQPDIFVPAGATEQVESIWITVPDVNPGTYTVTVAAKSGQTGATVERQFSIQLLACRGVELKVTETAKEVCAEAKQSVTYPLTVKNLGKTAESIEIFATADGQLLQWAVPSKQGFSLQAGEQTSVSLAVTPPANLPVGKKEIVITARTKAAYAVSTQAVSLTLKKCFDFEASLAPAEKTACVGEALSYTLSITNRGQEDSFSLTLPAGVEAERSVRLKQNEKKDVAVTVKPGQVGRTPYTITVTPAANAALQKSLSLAATGLDCRDLAVIIIPAKTSACSGVAQAFDVLVKNTGSVDSNIELSTDLGTLERQSLALRAKDSATIKLNVPVDFVGEKIVTVTTKTAGITDKSYALVTAEDCYAATLKVVPERQSVCACDSAQASVELTNTGKVSDTFTLAAEGQSKTVTLGAGQTEKLAITLPFACSSQAGARTVTATAKSARTSLTAAGVIDVKDTNACFSSTISGPSTVNLDSKPGPIQLKVRNTGQKKATFIITMAAPQWVYFSPTNLTLNGGEEKGVFLYASPQFDTAAGTYPIKVAAKSQFTESSFSLNVGVGQPAKPAQQPAQTTPTVPAEKPAGQPTNLTQTATPPATTVKNETPAKPAQPTTPTTGAVVGKPSKIEMSFVNHVQSGLPEQDVFVERNNSVYRLEAREAAASIYATPLFAAAQEANHDPFKLGANPLGPYPKGKPLGFTLGDWLAGAGSGSYAVDGQTAGLNLRFTKLVKNSAYTVWCSRMQLAPQFAITDLPCGKPDGSENVFQTDGVGNGAFSLKLNTLPASSKSEVTAIAIAYHSDGKTYGADPGVFGVNSHVQLFYLLPEPAPPASGVELTAGISNASKAINITGKSAAFKIDDKTKIVAIGVIAFVVIAILVARFVTIAKK
ncbi:MAG: hypothetical protein HY519_02950 [Candidatus Aenigmarchaeota archaeon]|nr:hypothetical protein [Candidatus Aenigmarchaeota archaeon]